MVYCVENDVYEACGMSSTIIQSLSGKSEAEVTTLIGNFIAKADARIKGLLNIPITVRKEQHGFEENEYIELGPYEEKDFEMFGAFDPTNCVEDVFAVYLEGNRLKLPYPKDCDSTFTEATTGWGVSNVTLTPESTVELFKCGTKSLKAVVGAGGGYIKYPSTANLHKNISPWGYVGFWFYSSDATATFTLKLYDVDGNYEYIEFTVEQANTWYIVMLNLSKLLVSGTDIDWANTFMEYFVINASKTCTFYLDNFNFNDGVFWTTPIGYICWSNPDSDPYGDIEVTYAYDPYKVAASEQVKTASSKLAGVYLLDYLIGCRQRTLAFEQQSEDLEDAPDRETLAYTRNRLQREAEEELAAIGYGAYEGFAGE